MLHTFHYNTYAEYLEAYTALVRLNEAFSYNRNTFTIQVQDPDNELVNILNGFIK